MGDRFRPIVVARTVIDVLLSVVEMRNRFPALTPMVTPCWRAGVARLLTAARAWSELAANAASPLVQAAGGATGVNWQVVAGSAGTTAEDWAAGRRRADEQAAYWSTLFADALASELRMTPLPSGVAHARGLRINTLSATGGAA